MENPNSKLTTTFTDKLMDNASQCQERTQIKPKDFNWSSKELKEKAIN